MNHSVLRDDLLYICDNGRILHGKCAGMTARATGYDLDGIECVPMTDDDVRDFIDEFGSCTCERCGKGD